MKTTTLLLTLALTTTSPVTGFTLAPSVTQKNHVARTASSSRRMIPVEDVSNLVDATNSAIFSNDLLMSKADTGGLAKAVIITLLFGGGLIPAAISANKAMIGTLTGKRRGGEKNSNVILKNPDSPTASLDPYYKQESIYVPSSGATGPNLVNSQLMFPSESIPLVDIIAIMGRIKDLDSVANWKDLPSTRLPNIINPEKPPMYLPRPTFKVNIRKAKFLKWPVDPKTGEPVGGAELAKAEKNRISKPKVVIGDAALDAVFDAWAGGASFVTPDKVERGLDKYRPNAEVFDVGKFSGDAIGGRSITGFAALTFVVIQVVAYGTLFIAPLLRAVFDFDIGFGSMGSCTDGVCRGFSDFL